MSQEFSCERLCYLADMKTTKFLSRLLLGAALMFAGIGHLTFARETFQAQVPSWLPLDRDFVVLASGVVEIGLGLALTSMPKFQAQIGLVTALFFVAVFPGNISQFLTHSDAFGLNSDQARLARLFFQPLLVIWALWSTGAWSHLKRRILHLGTRNQRGSK
jgi:uncharacterized membrane protein